MQEVIWCGIFHDNTNIFQGTDSYCSRFSSDFNVLAREGRKNTDAYEIIILLFLSYLLLIMIKKISQDQQNVIGSTSTKIMFMRFVRKNALVSFLSWSSLHFLINYSMPHIMILELALRSIKSLYM